MSEAHFISSAEVAEKRHSKRMVRGHVSAARAIALDLASASRGSGVLYFGGTPGASDVCAYMTDSPNVVASLAEQIRELTERVAALESEVWEYDAREISEAEAKKEIAAYFEEHHGEAIYPSDVAANLRLDYHLVVQVVEQLEKDGKIGEVRPSP